MAAVLAMSGSAFAQVYIGAGAGLTNYAVDCDGAESCDTTSSGGKVYAGYAFTPNVAAEIGYLDFGKAKTSGYVNYYGSWYLLHVDLKSTAVTAAVALRAALSPSLSGVARFGVSQTKVTSQVYSGGAHAPDESQTKTKPYVGLGLEYGFTKNVKGTLSADFTQGEVEGDSGSLRMVGVGLQYNF